MWRHTAVAVIALKQDVGALDEAGGRERRLSLSRRPHVHGRRPSRAVPPAHGLPREQLVAQNRNHVERAGRWQSSSGTPRGSGRRRSWRRARAVRRRLRARGSTLTMPTASPASARIGERSGVRASRLCEIKCYHQRRRGLFSSAVADIHVARVRSPRRLLHPLALSSVDSGPYHRPDARRSC